MPQILRIGPYSIYFWSNEGDPLEPIHVHVSEGRASATATKIWITSTGKTILSNNNSKIPEKILKRLMRMITANSSDIMDEWLNRFGEIRYFCEKIPAFICWYFFIIVKDSETKIRFWIIQVEKKKALY